MTFYDTVQNFAYKFSDYNTLLRVIWFYEHYKC